MIESDKYAPPQAEKKDKAIAVVRAAVGSIPYVGNAAIELMPLLFTAPLERRRQEWMNTVASALRELDQERRISLDELQSDEAFISVLVQSSQVAVRNHQREKIEALRQAVCNSAGGVDIEEDLQLLFVRFIDELTPSHLALLRFFDGREAEFRNVESYEQLFQTFCAGNAEATVTRDEFRLFSEELKTRNLIRISANVDDFSGVGSNTYIVTEGSSAGPMLLVTEIGKKLLAFISRSTESVLTNSGT